MPVGAWIYEIKFDGYRALALRAGGETRILSRSEKDFGSKFPAVRDSIAALDVQMQSLIMPLAHNQCYAVGEAL